MDLLAAEPGGVEAALRLVRESPLPCIVTVRSASEGGGWDGDDAARISFLEAVGTSGHPPRYIDVELAALERSANLRQKVLLAVAHPGQVREGLAGLIVSSHDMDGRPADLSRRVASMWSDPACAVAKVAWRARSVRDCAEAAELLSMRARPTAAICMGEHGLLTRVLAPKLGSFIAYAHVDGEQATAPGQLSVRDLVQAWRIRSVSAATATYAVIGWPVAQSRSPALHNSWFEAAGIDARYLPLPVAPGWEPFKATLAELLACAPLGLKGVSVTHPHKEHLVRLVRESGGTIDAECDAIGAANTLIVLPGGGLRALNTDAPAIAHACAAEGGAAAWKGRRAAIIGAGGVARAAAHALAGLGAHVLIAARDVARARALAERVEGGAGAIPLAALAEAHVDAIVQATPVGMQGGPDPDGVPLPADMRLGPGITVLDTVYAPEETPLLRQARAAGARAISGMSVFMEQARLQFRAWTGRDPVGYGCGPSGARAPLLPVALAWLGLTLAGARALGAPSAVPCAGHAPLDPSCSGCSTLPARAAPASMQLRMPGTMGSDPARIGAHVDPVLAEELIAWCEARLAPSAAGWPDLLAAHRDYLAAWIAAERQVPIDPDASGGMGIPVALAELERRHAVDAALWDRLAGLAGPEHAATVESWRRARRCAVMERLAHETGGGPAALLASAAPSVPFEIRSAASAYARISEDCARALLDLRMQARGGADVEGLRSSERAVRARWIAAERAFEADCIAAGPDGAGAVQSALVAAAYPDLFTRWPMRAQVMRAIILRVPGIEPASRDRAIAAIAAYARARWDSALREIAVRRDAGARMPVTASAGIGMGGMRDAAAPGIRQASESLAEDELALIAALAESLGSARARAIQSVAFGEVDDPADALGQLLGEEEAATALQELPREAVMPREAMRTARPGAYALPAASAALGPPLSGAASRDARAVSLLGSARTQLDAAIADDAARWQRDVDPLLRQVAAQRMEAERAVRAGDAAAFDRAAAACAAADARARDAADAHDAATFAGLARVMGWDDSVPGPMSRWRLARIAERASAGVAPPAGATASLAPDGACWDGQAFAAALAGPSLWEGMPARAGAAISAAVQRAAADSGGWSRDAMQAAVTAERARIRADQSLREVDALVRAHGSPPAGDPAAFQIQQARLRSAEASRARAEALDAQVRAQARAALGWMSALDGALAAAESPGAEPAADARVRCTLAATALRECVPEWAELRALLEAFERPAWAARLDSESADAAAQLWIATRTLLEDAGGPDAGDSPAARRWRLARGALEQAADRVRFLSGLTPGGVGQLPAR